METTNELLVIDRCTIPGKLKEFSNLSIMLDQSQKSLNQYLDSKKLVFPRFFFISNNDLLSIFGNSNPEGAQQYIIKVYLNFYLLQLEKNHKLHSNIFLYFRCLIISNLLLFRTKTIKLLQKLWYL